MWAVLSRWFDDAGVGYFSDTNLPIFRLIPPCPLSGLPLRCLCALSSGEMLHFSFAQLYYEISWTSVFGYTSALNALEKRFPEVSTATARPSGFINLTIPIQLDRYLDMLVSRGVDRFYFPEKRLVWQAAVLNWLDTRPDLKDGVAYLESRATRSVHGTTDFVQRRVQLGEVLEQRVRALSSEMVYQQHRPLPLARIIYTAVDYYCRYVATPENAFRGIKHLDDSPTYEGVLKQADTRAVRLEVNLKETNPERIVNFIRASAGGNVELFLNVRLDHETAHSLLQQLIGDRQVDEHEVVKELTKRLIQVGKR
jgi:hypothetical protein